VDLLVVRELTGGIYFGEKTRTATSASDVCSYTVEEIERVVRVAGHLALGRRKKITSVDKANVLETSRLWREVAERVVKAEFPGCRLERPGHEPVVVDLEVRHTSTISLADGRRVVRAGCRFVNTSSAGMGLIAEFLAAAASRGPS
jgi:hypothetical protein